MNKTLMHNILILCALFSGQFMVGQSTLVTGVVHDNYGEILIGVNVYIADSYDGASTDINGKFEFTTSETGSAKLITSLIGYEEVTVDIQLEGTEVTVPLVLKEKFNELKAVTITAGAFSAGDSKKATVLSSLEVVTTAGASGDITGALQTLTGTSTNGEDGRLFVRGGSGDETQTYINGTLVQVPYAPSPPNTAVRGKFNPFIFQGILFSTGGYSAEYGQALSAALILETKDKVLEDQINVSLSTVFGGLGAAKAFEKGSVKVDFDYTNLAPYAGLVIQDIDWIKPFEGANGSLSIARETKKDGMLKLYSNYSIGDFELHSADINQPSGKIRYDLQNQNSFTNLSWKGILNNSWSMHVGSSFTYDIQDVGIEVDQLKKTTAGSHNKLMLKHHFTEQAQMKMGIELMTKSKNQLFTDVEANQQFENGFDETKVASFAESQLYVSNRLAFSAGLRGEHSKMLKQSTLSPRLSAAYQMGQNQQISFAYGHFYQDPLDDYLQYTTEISEEKAVHYILNYQYKSKGRMVRAELYYKQYSKLVRIQNPDLFFQPTAYHNTGTGYAQGLDLFYKDSKTIKNGSYWVSYSYLDTKRLFRDFPVAATPTFASTHNLSVVYKHWFAKAKTMLSSTYNYNSPRTYHDPNSSEFNAGKIKPYQSLNVSVSYLFREHVIFYTSVINVLGYKNEFGYQYRNSPDEMGVYARRTIKPPADRFFFVGCFITFTKSGNANQMDTLN